MYFIIMLCFLSFTIVLGRAFYLHLSTNSELKWIADKQYNARIPLSKRRGRIFDRNGAELAVSLPVPSIYVDPVKIENAPKVAKELSKVLNLREKDILAKLKTPRRFVWIKRRISYDTLKKVVALNLPGVDYIEESKRFYPNGELASQVLGAVGYDSQSLGGIEMKFDDVLISKKELTSHKRDARGKLYSEPVGFGDQSDVGEVYLTIDKRIQFFTENALRRVTEEFNAKSGVAVVIDPDNGDILAMANSAHFDPNRYSKYAVENWRNRTVSDAFEPGSTFKVLVVASALEDGIVNAESVFDCERGAYRIGNNVLKDHHPYGDLSVQDIIKYSSNIGAMKIGFELGKKNLYNTLKKFGIGVSTGVPFPGEVKGILRDYNTWQKVEHATVAFGQGLTATPLQMTAAFSAAVNGGNYFKPRLVTRTVDRSGKVSVKTSEVATHPIKKEISETMRYMLRRVVEEGGTGVNANSEAFAIGGKTGTAQKVVPGGKGYSKNKYFASFIGFAPVDDPKVVVFVGLDEPKRAHYGGTVAAPAVKEIIERSLNYMGVPSAKSTIMYSAERNIKSYEPKVKHEERDRNHDFLKNENGKYIMPDLTGLTLREVLSTTSTSGLEVVTIGSGIAAAQSPEPGGTIKKGEKFSVKFVSPR
jgi:cell division protein FtsI (penicillin-binding protein 3)